MNFVEANLKTHTYNDELGNWLNPLSVTYLFYLLMWRYLSEGGLISYDLHCMGIRSRMGNKVYDEKII